MLHENIPTHIICGQLGVGKTSLLRHLLKQKPANERWAVLINEFGQIGLDAALLDQANQDISWHEVAGGCLCCVNGLPFQVGLNRLLQKAKPQRLFIEPSGLGHPLQIKQQLEQLPWQQVLALQPLIYVLDAKALIHTPLSAEQQTVMQQAGLLLLNKADQVSSEQLAMLSAQLPQHIAQRASYNAQLDWQALPGANYQHSHTPAQLEAVASATLANVWLDRSTPFCAVTQSAQGWSIGWRWHNSQQFDLLKIQTWLSCQHFNRAKAVLNTNAGWLSLNLNAEDTVHWQASEWRNDSRLELIFSSAQDQAQLSHELTFCVVE